MTNNGHYGFQENDDYNGSQNSQANLIRSGLTGTSNSVGTSKRLFHQQCEAARTETMLPQSEN